MSLQLVEKRKVSRGAEDESRIELERAIDRVRRRRQTLVTVHYTVFCADVFALLVGFSVSNFIVYGFSDLPQLARVLAASIPLLIGYGLHDGIYGPRPTGQPEVHIARALKPLAWTAATLMLVAFMLKVGAQFSRAQFVMGTSLSGALICIFRMAISRYASGAALQGAVAELHIFDRVPLQVFGDGRLAIDAKHCGLTADLGDPAAINHLGYLARGVDSVVVHCKPRSRLAWANVLRTLDVPVEIIIPELEDLNALQITSRGNQCSVRLSDGRLPWDKAALKRAFDLFIVCASLPVLLVILLVVGILIKLDSPGPVFFRQSRIGVGNRPFSIWKFRSMRATDMSDPALRLTQRDDDRVTRLGKILRRLSIDEIPQLLNVLVGDMSLVGPRPHAPLALAGERLYWEVDQFYWQRHVIKPGITGLAQVRGFRGNTFEEDNLRDRLRADLEYVRNWSLALDIRILLGTLLVPFHRNAF